MSCSIDAREGEGDPLGWGLGTLGDGHHPPLCLGKLRGVGEQRGDVAVRPNAQQNLQHQLSLEKQETYNAVNP